MPTTPPRLPVWLIGLGALSVLFGLALTAGIGTGWHPLLASDGAGLVFIVSGVALAGSAAFPLVFARLAANDREPHQ